MKKDNNNPTTEKQKGTGKSVFTRETVGAVGAVFFLFAFLILVTGKLIFGKGGQTIQAFLLGLFGFGAYLVLPVLFVGSLKLLFGKRGKKSKKSGVLTVLVWSVFLLVHTALTFSWKAQGYLSACFDAPVSGIKNSTLAGWCGGLIVYPFKRFLTSIGAIIVFSLVAVVFAYLTYVAFSGKTGFEKKKKEEPSQKADSASAYPQAYNPVQNPAYNPVPSPLNPPQTSPTYDGKMEYAAGNANREERAYTPQNGNAYAYNGNASQIGQAPKTGGFDAQGGYSSSPNNDSKEAYQSFVQTPAVRQRPGVALSDSDAYGKPVRRDSAAGFSPFSGETWGKADNAPEAQAEKKFSDDPNDYASGREFLFSASPAEQYRKNLIFDKNSNVNKKPAVSPNQALFSGNLPSESYTSAYASSVNAANTERPNKIYTDSTGDRERLPYANVEEKSEPYKAEPYKMNTYTYPEPKISSADGIGNREELPAQRRENSFLYSEEEKKEERTDLFSRDAYTLRDTPARFSSEPKEEEKTDFSDRGISDRDRGAGFGFNSGLNGLNTRTDGDLFSRDRAAVSPFADRVERFSEEPKKEEGKKEEPFVRGAEEKTEKPSLGYRDYFTMSNPNIFGGNNDSALPKTPPQDSIPSFGRENNSLGRENNSLGRDTLPESRLNDSRLNLFDEKDDELPTRETREDSIRPISPIRESAETVRGFGRESVEEKKTEDKREDYLGDYTRDARGADSVFPTQRTDRATELKRDTNERLMPPEDSLRANRGDRTERTDRTDRMERNIEPPKRVESVKPEPPKAVEPPKPRVIRPYRSAPMDFFNCQDVIPDSNAVEVEGNKRTILETLDAFKVSDATIASVTYGPTVTRYNVAIPRNISPKKVVSLDQEIAMNLYAANGVNIYPNFEDGAVSIEVPNKKRQFVGLGCMIADDKFTKSKPTSLTFPMGKDVGNEKVYGDIRKMTHLLVAGASGSGKSVFLRSLIISLIMRYSPADLRLLLIDPKKTEFVIYDNLPHLVINEIITETNKVIQSLNWAIGEMNRRYGLFEQKSRAGTYVVNVDEYNANLTAGEEKLPKIVIIVDELADLMLAAKKDIEDRIQNLTQKSRAAGIHVIIATQRPSADVITGVIKSNLKTRIAFSVASEVDSRVILDATGAQKLLGYGDMLYTKEGTNTPIRVQSPNIESEDAQKVVNYIKSNNDCVYDEGASQYINNSRASSDSDSSDGDEGGVEEVYIEALRCIVIGNTASISMIQRKCSVGYNKAGKIIEWMEDMGYISAFDGAKARKVLITKEEFEEKYGPL